MRGVRFLILGMLLMAAAPVSAAGLKVVVFDIEAAGDTLPPAVKARLKAQSDMLRQLFAARGLTVVDTTPQAAKIKDNLPLSQCNGCDQDIAKALGADLEAATAVQAVSSVTFNLSGSIKDVKTNRVLREGVVDVRGTDEGVWAHGFKFLVRERLLTPPLPEDEAGLRKTVDAAPANP